MYFQSKFVKDVKKLSPIELIDLVTNGYRLVEDVRIELGLKLGKLVKTPHIANYSDWVRFYVVEDQILRTYLRRAIGKPCTRFLLLLGIYKYVYTGLDIVERFPSRMEYIIPFMDFNIISCGKSVNWHPKMWNYHHMRERIVCPRWPHFYQGSIFYKNNRFNMPSKFADATIITQ